MKKVFPLILFASAAVHAQDFATAYASLGEMIVTQFATAPFPHTNRANGHTYQGKFFSAKDHYSDSTVAVFIPKGFRETGRIDFVVHFHGWNNTVAGTLAQFKLAEQLVDSRKNAVLVVPEGPHLAPDSFGGKLEDPGGFSNFMNEVVATLKAKSSLTNQNFTLGNIILSGHSGGYHVMSAILARGNLTSIIREVWLFDALYGGTENFLSWSGGKNIRLLDIYTDHGGTKDETENLKQLLRNRGTSFLATEDSQVTRQQLRANPIIFLHTDMTHNDVLEKRKSFTEFLKTSFLDSNL